MPAHQYDSAAGFERRTFQMLEAKALDDAAGTFSGYLAVFNNVDQGGDKIVPGAFTKSLDALQTKQRSRKSRFVLTIFWSHMQEEPVGGFTEAYEDAHGLFVKGELDLDIEIGRRAYSGLKKGYMTGMSIGYITVRQDYGEGGVRLLKELRLVEGSLTAIPMNEDAQVTAVKTADEAAQKGQTMPTTDDRESRQPQRYVRPTDYKARDFDTLFQSLANADDLQDEWGDMFIAFTHAVSEVMWQQHAQANGWLAPDAPKVDAQEAVQANMEAFSTALLDLVQRSVAADFVPQLDSDGDQFIDPDGCNANGNEDADGYMSASADETKAGRVMSGANHDMMGKALADMKAGIDAVKAQHKALADMHARMAPNSQDDNGDVAPSDDDTQQASGSSDKTGSKSVQAHETGTGSGAASSDAPDSTIPEATTDDEEAAQRFALKISANLLAMKLRKGAA